MKLGGKAGYRFLTGALLSASFMALTPVGAIENPYSAIVERNVFNLHAPPPPVNPADLIKKAPPAKITMTGISTFTGKKMVFLTTPPMRPGGPPESFSLAEGQAQNEIEVKSIDEKAGVVQVVNHGDPQTLDFEHDGVKFSGAPAGVPQAVTLPAPVAAPAPAGVQMPAPGTMIRPLRSLPAPNNSGAGNNNNVGGLGGGVGAANQPVQDTMTPEEQVALIEIQRIKALKEHDPISNLLPQTPLTPEVMGQHQAPQ